MTAAPSDTLTGPAPRVHTPWQSTLTDGDLVAWRHAATTGGLPTPTRSRWQVLRAGVLDMWEYDVAEYWAADGRSQLLGANESGKSTLMTLTTLLMLVGDISPRYVDTMGRTHKHFRFYLEPGTGQDERRTAAGPSASGWAWVEYGRLDENGDPVYFTTLLHAHTQRTRTDVDPTWLTCTGTARVRAGIDLLHGRTKSKPTDLAEVPGMWQASNGAGYRARLASGLFGFDTTHQMDALTGMLKVLRTPQLGSHLSPTWFTEQMRQALPPLDEQEVSQLADGWNELDKLARDRDATAASRDAVSAFLRTAWRPWADAVLRRAADAVASATTQLDEVTRTVGRARATLEKAEAHREGLLAREQAALADRRDANTQLEALETSQSFRDARDATANVARLENEVTAHQKTVDQRRTAAENATTAEAAAHREVLDAAGGVEAAEARLASARSGATSAVMTARLAPTAEQWVADDDLDRLGAAVAERRGHLRTAMKLRRDRDGTGARLEAAAQQLSRAQRMVEETNAAVADADHALRGDLERLAATVHRWTQTIPVTDKPGEATEASGLSLADTVLNLVHEQVDDSRPTPIVRQHLNTVWLPPRQTPLLERVGAEEQTAARLSGQADDLDHRADLRAADPDPVPADPAFWSRRERPAATGDGAPLWWLLDPAENLPDTTLARLEAALAATGLLDAWVTADGIWQPDRDGDDTIATTGIAAAEPPAAAATASLSGTLKVAARAGALAPAVNAVLARIAWLNDAPAGQLRLPAGYAAALGADGRWASPLGHGRAAARHETASLLGAAAQAAARDRDVARLRAQAAELRVEAEAAQTRADRARRQAQALLDFVSRAPEDRPAIEAARRLLAAHATAETAETTRDAAAATLQKCQTAHGDADAALLSHAGTHRLDPKRLDQDSTLLDTAVEHIGHLDKYLTGRAAALGVQERAVVAATRATEFAVQRVGEATAADEQLRATVLARDTARRALTADALGLLQQQQDLRKRAEELSAELDQLNQDVRAKDRAVGEATAQLKAADQRREQAETDRADAVARWWVPVDAGLAHARGITASSEVRTATRALNQAREARDRLRPPGWPDTVVAHDNYVNTALANMLGNGLAQLNTVLQGNGGRYAAAELPDQTAGDGNAAESLPRVTVLVDAAGTAAEPPEALELLAAKTDELTAKHDDDLQRVLNDLLSSSFTEHLLDVMRDVEKLLADVNTVLAKHPTGVTRTVVRLQRVQAANQREGFEVIEALVNDLVDSPRVQEDIRRFLEQLIHQAQDEGASTGTDWTEHLARLLDYRRWFDVVAQRRVGDVGRFEPVTTEIFGRGSGGSQVFLLLQPMLAVLAALYSKSPSAPRPVWLDEAFEKVDPHNRATLLSLLVQFELDFLLVGPAALAATSQVPAAALWHVTRAPFPTPGVDLTLSLWAGGAEHHLEVPDMLSNATRTSHGAGDEHRSSANDAPLWDDQTAGKP